MCYYIHTLTEELGINSGSTINSTHEKQDVTVDEIIHHLTTEGEKFAKNILDTKTSQDTVQLTIIARKNSLLLFKTKLKKKLYMNY